MISLMYNSSQECDTNAPGTPVLPISFLMLMLCHTHLKSASWTPYTLLSTHIQQHRIPRKFIIHHRKSSLSDRQRSARPGQQQHSPEHKSNHTLLSGTGQPPEKRTEAAGPPSSTTRRAGRPRSTASSPCQTPEERTQASRASRTRSTPGTTSTTRQSAEQRPESARAPRGSRPCGTGAGGARASSARAGSGARCASSRFGRCLGGGARARAGASGRRGPGGGTVTERRQHVLSPRPKRYLL